MMKKQIHFIAASALLVLAACKKDNETSAPLPQPPVTSLITAIKQTTLDGQPYDHTREFAYDEQGRLKAIDHSGIYGGKRSERYSYNGNELQYRYFIDGAEISSASFTYMLNSQGLADSTVIPYPVTTSSYEYNNGGYLTRTNYNDNGIMSSFQLCHYNNRFELDSLTGITRSGVKLYVHVFSYEAGKTNTIGNANKGFSILGKDQAAPVKKRTLYSYQLSGHENKRMKYYEIDYTYEYDGAGRIKKHTAVQTQYNPNGSSQSYVKEVMEYTYKQ